jgi:hypothetical protein
MLLGVYSSGVHVILFSVFRPKDLAQLCELYRKRSAIRFTSYVLHMDVVPGAVIFLINHVCIS